MSAPSATRTPRQLPDAGNQAGSAPLFGRGVQSKPRMRTECRAFCRLSTSQTDSPLGRLLRRHEAGTADHTTSSLYPGRHVHQDNEGYIRNTSVITCKAGRPLPPASCNRRSHPQPIPQPNIVSTDYLQTINLTGWAHPAATTTIAIGANLRPMPHYDRTLANTAQAGYQRPTSSLRYAWQRRHLQRHHQRSPRATSGDTTTSRDRPTSVMSFTNNTR
jgi:hypothetical protein